MRFWFYNSLFFVSLPLLAILTCLKALRKPAYRARFFSRFGLQQFIVIKPIKQAKAEKAANKNPSYKKIMIHAVSVGETHAALLLVEKLAKQHPENLLDIVITTTTPTSFEYLQKYAQGLLKPFDHVSIKHHYLPFDAPIMMSRFFKVISPDLLLVIETEAWPNMLCTAKKLGTSAILVNARLSTRSFMRYDKVVNGFLRHIAPPFFTSFTKILAQYPKDRAHFLKLGVSKENCFSCGSLKAAEFAKHKAADNWIVEMGETMKLRFILCIASSHVSEEKYLTKSLKTCFEKVPNLFVIWAPRHPDRFQKLYKNLVLQFDEKDIALRSLKPEQDQLQTTKILVADTLGEMHHWHKLADASFIGGSLTEKRGGQNPFEALQGHAAVITGSFVSNFESVYADLIDKNAAVQLGEADDLNRVIFAHYHDKKMTAKMVDAGRAYLENAKKGLERQADIIKHYL